jgi:hypothetical protein
MQTRGQKQKEPARSLYTSTGKENDDHGTYGSTVVNIFFRSSSLIPCNLQANLWNQRAYMMYPRSYYTSHSLLQYILLFFLCRRIDVYILEVTTHLTPFCCSFPPCRSTGIIHLDRLYKHCIIQSVQFSNYQMLLLGSSKINNHSESVYHYKSTVYSRSPPLQFYGLDVPQYCSHYWGRISLSEQGFLPPPKDCLQNDG